MPLKKLPVLLAMISASGTLASAQVFIANAGAGDGSVSEYTSTGSIIAAPFISTGTDTHAIALSGNDLFTADFASGTISEYSASTGQLMNSSFANVGLGAYGMAVGNNLLYVSNYYTSTVFAFSLSTPSTVVWSHQLSSEGGMGGVAVSGNNLYVADYNSVLNLNALTGALTPFSIGFLDGTYGVAATSTNLYVTSVDGTVGEYSLTGQPENTSLVSGFVEANGIATDGTSLYVSNGTKVNIYDAANGELTGDITSGLSQPSAIAATPEPASFMLGLLAVAALIFLRLERRRLGAKGAVATSRPVV